MTRISEQDIIGKPVRWIGAAYRELTGFPPITRKRAGMNLGLVQRGGEPEDWKPMPSVGTGACELRVRSGEGGTVQHRVVYVARFPEAVYVLHAFEKKTRATPAHHVDVARARYRALQRQRGVNR